jgi:hypothetical protein
MSFKIKFQNVEKDNSLKQNKKLIILFSFYIKPATIITTMSGEVVQPILLYGAVIKCDYLDSKPDNIKWAYYFHNYMKKLNETVPLNHDQISYYGCLRYYDNVGEGLLSIVNVDSASIYIAFEPPTDNVKMNELTTALESYIQVLTENGYKVETPKYHAVIDWYKYLLELNSFVE